MLSYCNLDVYVQQHLTYSPLRSRHMLTHSAGPLLPSSPSSYKVMRHSRKKPNNDNNTANGQVERTCQMLMQDTNVVDVDQLAQDVIQLEPAELTDDFDLDDEFI